MIRILHMIGSLEMGGAQTMIMSIYRMLDKAEIQFDFIVDVQEKGCFEEEITASGGRIFQIPKFNGRNLNAVQRAWKAFFKEHPEYKVLHSHIRSYASLFIPVARACGVKTIIHSHNTSNGSGIQALGKMLLQYPLRFQADYYFGCSEMSGRWLFGQKVVQSDRFFILRNAVDMERFAFDRNVRERVRRELGAGEDTLLLGHVGRFHPQKNHQFLLRVFQKLAKVRSDAKLVLLGDGELRNEISAQISELGLAERVEILGVRSNIEDYLCAMDVLLLPSLHEGLPVIVIEAQANGLMSFVSDAVTKEVGLSDLVRYLPIDQGEEKWVDALERYAPVRKNVSEAIEEHGYSVKSSAEWLYDFYREISV